MKTEIEKSFDKDFPEDVNNPFVGSMYNVYEKGFRSGKGKPLPKELVKRLKERIKEAIKNKDDMDSVSWGYQEGILISPNEAKLILGKR
jgi:hypothetical protein